MATMRIHKAAAVDYATRVGIRSGAGSAANDRVAPVGSRSTVDARYLAGRKARPAAGNDRCMRHARPWEVSQVRLICLGQGGRGAGSTRIIRARSRNAVRIACPDNRSCSLLGLLGKTWHDQRATIGVRLWQLGEPVTLRQQVFNRANRLRTFTLGEKLRCGNSVSRCLRVVEGDLVVQSPQEDGQRK